MAKDWTQEKAIEALEAENARLRAALREISERHVPDQPSCLDIDEADYVRRQHTELRRIARAALETPTKAAQPRMERSDND